MHLCLISFEFEAYKSQSQTCESFSCLCVPLLSSASQPRGVLKHHRTSHPCYLQRKQKKIKFYCRDLQKKRSCERPPFVRSPSEMGDLFGCAERGDSFVCIQAAVVKHFVLRAAWIYRSLFCAISGALHESGPIRSTQSTKTHTHTRTHSHTHTHSHSNT